MKSGALRSVAGLLLLTAAAYLPATTAGFVWDDDAHLTDNRVVLAPDGLGKIWTDPSATAQYYPVVFSAFWLQHRLWGLRPSGYHIVNILLHALNAVLVWLILRRLSLPGAWLAAAVFALHPVHVESVAWVSELKNVLSGALYLASLLAYLRFAGIGAGPPAKWTRAGHVERPGFWYVLSLGLFLAALLSKTVTCSLPAVLAVLVWWKRGRLTKADVLPLIPMFLLGAGLGLCTISLEARHFEMEPDETWSLSGPGRVLIAGRALWFYAGKLFWPHPLMFMYPRWQVDTAAWWQWLFPASAAAVLAGAWMFRQRLGRGPAAALMIFTGTLMPALGFFNVYPFRYTFVEDHFQYLASISLIAAGVAWAVAVVRQLGPRAARGGVYAGAVILMVFGALTWRQTGIYKDKETLWLSVLERHPASWMAHNNLGLVRYAQGRNDEAMVQFQEAVRLNPRHARAYNNIGLILQAQGRVDEAIANYRKAIEIAPKYFTPYNSLGSALIRQGKIEEAEASYREAIRLQPDFPEAHYNYGLMLANLGRVSEAIEQQREAVQWRPGYVKARYQLATLLQRAGKLDEARRQFAILERINASRQPAP